MREGSMSEYPGQVRKWGVFEVSVEGPSDGNPFVEQKVRGLFSGAGECVITEGFYDGDGIYKVRFMPSHEGKYSFTIRTSFMTEAAGGFFEVLPADENNHGPVRVRDGRYFAYEDGTPYISVGTTAYVWDLQSDERIAETLHSLKRAHFNKIRFCIFPKHYDYNLGEPRSYPYEGTPMDSSVLTSDNFMEYFRENEDNHFDLTRFNPEHFRHIEYCIEELGKLGIEADLIVMHPYDRWGFSRMSREEDDLYWNYVIRRFSHYHNVWWSLANEFDLMASKTEEDWEHYGDLLVHKDPYGHLRSIHNCRTMYDHSRPWITHCSVQRIDLYKGAELTDELMEKYNKPVVMDEIAYEGDIPHGWGNITGEEMVRRFWETSLRGGFPGHGETYLNDENVLWWSHGGALRGESWKRFGLLHDVLSEVPGGELVRADLEWDSLTAVPAAEKDLDVRSMYLFYYSFMRPSYRTFHIDDETWFAADVIDTWNMTITKEGVYRGAFRIDLPARQYMAVRLRKALPEEIPVEENTAEFELIIEEEAENALPAAEEETAVEEAVIEVPETVETESEETIEPETEEAAEETPAEVPVTEDTFGITGLISRAMENLPDPDDDDDFNFDTAEIEAQLLKNSEGDTTSDLLAVVVGDDDGTLEVPKISFDYDKEPE